MRRSLLRDSLRRVRTRRLEGEAGFTLLEVLVAITLLAIVATAAIPVMVSGLRNGVAAKYLTQARLLAQQRLDEMRNLPFSVPPQSGPYIDVLDNYYTNDVAPTTTPTCTSGGTLAFPASTWKGFVNASGVRCSYEPTGPFYRTIKSGFTGFPNFYEVVDTQFLNSARQAMGPGTCGFDTQSTTPCKYTPISQLLGITVTVIYPQFGGNKAYSFFSELTDNGSNTPLVVAFAQSLPVKLVAGTDQGRLTVQAGVTNQSGQLYNAPLVNSGAVSLTSDFGGTNVVNASSQSAAAPPDTGPLSGTGVALDPYTSGLCTYVCWGPTAVSNVKAQTSTRVPLAGTPASPVTSSMPSSATTVGGVPGFELNLSNGVNSALLLDTSSGLAHFDAASGGTLSASNCSFAPAGANTLYQGTSYIDASSGNTNHYVDTCATAQVATFDLLPTTWAPQGLIQVSVTKSRVECKVNVASGTPTASTPNAFVATVRINAQSGPLTYNIATGQSDVLSGVDLNTVVYSNGAVTKRLGDYVQKMNSSPNATVVGSGSQTQVQIPGIVILTQPIQDPSSTYYASSAISAAFGNVQCEAEDFRS